MAYKLEIDQNRCKGCGLCVSVCPKNVLEISSNVNSNGYFAVFLAHPEDCIFCAMCCEMCPDVALTITEDAKSKDPAKTQYQCSEAM